MSTHVYHPDVHASGLADDCERCAEQGASPFELLDDTSMRVLLDRIRGGLDARSENEAMAMNVVKTTLRQAQVVERLTGLRVAEITPESRRV